MSHLPDMSYNMYTFLGTKRRLFNVEGSYLIQLELLDKVTLSYLGGTVDAFIVSKEHDRSTNVTHLKLLEDV